MVFATEIADSEKQNVILTNNLPTTDQQLANNWLTIDQPRGTSIRRVGSTAH
jgi:hypothetical protein